MTRRGWMAAAIILATLAGCGPARVGEPVAPPVVLASSEAEAGERVYMTYCHQCHPGGAAGLGPAVNDKPLPRWAIKQQVRRGLGAMPAFGPETIDDRELDQLTTYMVALRQAR